MGRSATFTVDALLDAARQVVLDQGLRAASIAAIARQAGAPVGSIYHRFASVDELLAATWLRAVDATQRVPPRVIEGVPADADPVRVMVDIAVANYDHCVENPKDILLLDRIDHRDLASFNLSAEQRAEIRRSDKRAVNQIKTAATALFGDDGLAARDAVVLAIVDLPLSFARRYLDTGHAPPPSRRTRLAAAVRAVLQQPSAAATVER